MTPRTVKTNMNPFRQVVVRACNKGVLRQNPFFDFIPERVIPKRPWLSNDEIQRMMQAKLKLATWRFTRDMFIFRPLQELQSLIYEILNIPIFRKWKTVANGLFLTGKRPEQLRISHCWIFLNVFLKDTEIRSLPEQVGKFSNYSTMFL